MTVILTILFGALLVPAVLPFVLGLIFLLIPSRNREETESPLKNGEWLRGPKSRSLTAPTVDSANVPQG